MNKTILYIAGAGYSGSTLLDLLLSSHDNAFGVGEIHHFQQAWLTNSLCGCGSPIQKCSFWVEVYSEFCSRYGVAKDFASKKECLLTHVPNPRRLSRNVYFDENWSMEEFVKQNYLLYDIIFKKSGKSIIIDSSKQAHRAALVAQMAKKFDVNVYLIHLIRDAKAVCYSHLKKKREKRGKSILKSLAIWYLDNKQVESIAAKKYCVPGKNIIHISYEDLTKYPEQALGVIFRKSEIEFHDNILENFTSDRVIHNIGGNPMKVDVEKKKKIMPDDEWKSKLTLFQKSMITGLGGVFNYNLKKKCKLS